MNYELSWFLRRHPSEYHTLDDLAEIVRIPAAQVSHDLEEMAVCGFQFDHHPLQGSRLAGVPAIMDRDEIAFTRRGRRLGRSVRIYARTGSTNDLALAAARAGGNATDGLVILAEEQTVGRGRQGARWFGSPGESLLVSVVYWSAQQADTPARLMMAASVALAEALERTSGVRVGIKWPNDLEIGRKKICGILIECGGSVKPTRHIPADGPGELVASVIGFGLNVNQANQKTFPPELSERATSLQMAAGATLDRSLLLTEILESLETCIELTGEDFLESLAARYMRHCDMIGRRVTVREGSARFSGTVVSVSPDYALIMRLEDGALRSFKAPTVRIE